MGIELSLAANYQARELEALFNQYKIRAYKIAAKIRHGWDRAEVRELFDECSTAPHKAKCTTSVGRDEDDEDQTDWRERYESTREAPYGCLTEDDMRRAIMDNDLETIEDSPVLANIALGNMLKEYPELEQQLDEKLRGGYKDLLWDEMTDIPRDAFTMIEEQRSLSPKRETWQDQRKLSKALLSIF